MSVLGYSRRHGVSKEIIEALKFEDGLMTAANATVQRVVRRWYCPEEALKYWNHHTNGSYVITPLEVRIDQGYIHLARKLLDRLVASGKLEKTRISFGDKRKVRWFKVDSKES